jgi:hypothetical protein
MLTLEHTVRAYSGRPGCMCGCKGEYKDSERARKMAITQLLKNPDARVQSWNQGRGDDAGCVFVDTDTRTRALYLTEEGVAIVRAMGVKEYR